MPLPAAQLEQELNHPDRARRLHALHELKRLADAGQVKVDPPRPWVNMHCHSFHSYNAHGFSPSRIAWEAHRRGLAAAGIVDFDVLDALDETLAASDTLLSKLTVGLESRVFVQEFEREVLNSPNEPGIAYYMGVGFVQPPPANSPAAHTLRRMREGAAVRNRTVMQNVNAYLVDVVIDYDQDVLPLTPSNNATERHMLQAYDLKAQQVFPDPARRAAFWAAKLQVSGTEAQALLRDTVRLRDTMRKKLMKYGSPGYVAPDPKNFPSHTDTVAMIRACGAVPMYAWLDGTNAGESDTELLLDFFTGAGQAAINIIPDRNWNIKDPIEKAQKVAKLNEMVAAARARNLPICVGTEMNNAAQPLVDHFDSVELKPHVETFLEGAQILWGHALLLRHGGFGYLSSQADAAFKKDLVRKNAFFRDVGSRPVPHGSQLQTLRTASRAGDVKGVVKALA